MYFINRGIAYGFGLGALTGTIVPLPILGTILGAFFGSVVGCAVGLGVALVLVPTFLLTYRPRRTNLRQYSRQFARCAAALVTLIALTLLWYSTTLNWEPGWKLLILATIIIAGLWAILAVAYTAHLYPYYIANRHNPRIAVPTDDQPPPLFSVMIGSVADSVSLAWLLGLAVLGGIAVSMTGQAEVFQDMERFALGVLVATLSLWISPIYTLPANTILMRFLRRLIFDDYLPYLSSQTRRVTETIIVFIATCGFIWWIGFLVPLGVLLLGLYSARVHYVWYFFQREEMPYISGGEELSSNL